MGWVYSHFISTMKQLQPAVHCVPFTFTSSALQPVRMTLFNEIWVNIHSRYRFCLYLKVHYRPWLWGTGPRFLKNENYNKQEYWYIFFSMNRKNLCSALSKLKQEPQMTGQNLIALPFDTNVQFPIEKIPSYTIWKINWIKRDNIIAKN